MYVNYFHISNTPPIPDAFVCYLLSCNDDAGGAVWQRHCVQLRPRGVSDRRPSDYHGVSVQRPVFLSHANIETILTSNIRKRLQNGYSST